MSDTAILILAAGLSSRMGKIKQLLPYKHTTLLGWAIEQAQASKVDENLCVLGANAETIKKSLKNDAIKIVPNPNYTEGLSSSIVVGINELKRKDAVLIMLADQPHVTTMYLNKLLETSLKFPSRIIASDYGKSTGVPALFPRKFFPELLKLSGDKGAKEYLEKVSDYVVKVAAPSLQDIDTAEDYIKLIK